MKNLFLILIFLGQITLAYEHQNYLCIKNSLYKPDGTDVFVGSNACNSAKLGGGYACVAGSLYKPDSTDVFVGSNACREQFN